MIKSKKKMFPSLKYVICLKLFLQWYQWIENTINKEVLSTIFKDKLKSSPQKQKPKVGNTNLIMQEKNTIQPIIKNPTVVKKNVTRPKTFGGMF